MEVATLIAVVGVVGLVLCLGARKVGTGVGILAGTVAVIVHGLFVSHLDGWSILYAVLAVGVVIYRSRGVAPRGPDSARELFLKEFPDERPSSKSSGEKSEHIRRSFPDITREPPCALTDPETASEG